MFFKEPEITSCDTSEKPRNCIPKSNSVNSDVPIADVILTSFNFMFKEQQGRM